MSSTVSQAAPKISVITVVRNGEATLRETMDSILGNLGTTGEYLIVDGASTDRTKDIIDQRRESLSYFVSEADRGIYDAMNKAMLAARGDWLIFVGADDQLLVELDDIVRVMKNPAAVYYGDVIIANTGARYAGKFSKYKLMQRNICHQSIFYPRGVYSTKNYETGIGMLADHKYNIEVWGSGVQFEYIDQVICRFNDQGASNNAHHSFEATKLKAIRESFGWAYYNVKRLRSRLVAAIKGSHEST
jgi:glycosyltransferase involved in cell wall biosynthesis